MGFRAYIKSIPLQAKVVMTGICEKCFFGG